jgi:hypothetical protein
MNMNLNFRVIAGGQARLMHNAGLAISAIAKLIGEDATRKESVDGGEYLDGFTTAGLMLALELLADRLIDRGDEVSALTDPECGQ